MKANTPAKSESLQHSRQQKTEGFGLCVNKNKIESNDFKQEGAFSTLIGKPLKLVDQFIYPGSNISSTENKSIYE